MPQPPKGIVTWQLKVMKIEEILHMVFHKHILPHKEKWYTWRTHMFLVCFGGGMLRKIHTACHKLSQLGRCWCLLFESKTSSYKPNCWRLIALYQSRGWLTTLGLPQLPVQHGKTSWLIICLSHHLRLASEWFRCIWYVFDWSCRHMSHMHLTSNITFGFLDGYVMSDIQILFETK